MAARPEKLPALSIEHLKKVVSHVESEHKLLHGEVQLITAQRFDDVGTIFTLLTWIQERVCYFQGLEDQGFILPEETTALLTKAKEILTRARA